MQGVHRAFGKARELERSGAARGDSVERANLSGCGDYCRGKGPEIEKAPLEIRGRLETSA